MVVSGFGVVLHLHVVDFTVKQLLFQDALLTSGGLREGRVIVFRC